MFFLVTALVVASAMEAGKARGGGREARLTSLSTSLKGGRLANTARAERESGREGDALG